MKPWARLGNGILFGILIIPAVGGLGGVAGRQGEVPTNGPFLGKLTRVFAIGGETTGWSLQLESERKVDGTTVKQIEVDPRPRGIRLEPFENKRVEITGTLTWRSGVERRRYPVVVIETVRERAD